MRGERSYAAVKDQQYVVKARMNLKTVGLGGAGAHQTRLMAAAAR